MARQVSNSSEVAELVAQINDLARKRPICLISIEVGEHTPAFDVAEIEASCGEVADYFVIQTGPLTRELEQQLPPKKHVFGGAARSYPIDFAATNGDSVGNLRYAIPAQLKSRSTQRLIGDIFGHALAAGLITGPKPGTKLETAEVANLFGAEVAVLKRTNGQLISLNAELTFPGVPLDHVLRVGQQVSGYFDEEQKLFTLEHQTPDLQTVVDHFGYGTVTLGLVKSTDRKKAMVALHPNLVVEVTKEEITGNPKDVVENYRREGLVYPFRLYRDPQGRTRLSCIDIDDDEPIAPAMSLLPGGDPWLEEDLGVIGGGQIDEVFEVTASEVAVADFATVQAEIESALAGQGQEVVTTDTGSHRVIAMPGLDGISRGVASTPDKDAKKSHDAAFVTKYYGLKFAEAQENLNLAQSEAQLYAAQLNTANQKVSDLGNVIFELRANLSKLRKEKRSLQGASSARDPWESLAHFATKEEWLREEVRRLWIESYTPDDRRRFDINATKWSFTPAFFDDFDTELLNEEKLRKVIRTILELVAGRNDQPGHTESHPLLDGGKPGTRGRDIAMRMYVEENTAGARRLHFWKLAEGGVELNCVVTHDNYEMR